MSTKTLSARASSSVKRVAPQSRKVTVTLPEPLAQKLREAVEKGAAPSQNALVREAVKREMKRLRDEEIERAYADAAADPIYMQDLEDCMRDFADLDRDSLQYIDVEPNTDEVGP